MSDRERFVELGRRRWDRLEHILGQPRLGASDWSELASLYRSVCADLAAAQSRHLPRDVVGYLDELAGRAHNALYGAQAIGTVNLWEVVTTGFPRELRAQWRYFLMANLLFYGPFLLALIGAFVDESFAGRILGEAQLGSVESMYEQGDLGRSAGEDASMAGFYVYNNVGIAFRCFATGGLFGLGSVFFLIYNGLIIGTVMGHLFGVGSGMNLFNFICGHGPWELTAIVISGAAGLRLGWALIVTEGRTRVGSLKAAGPVLYRLVVGAAVMLMVAALVEGFWSASPVPPAGKWVFAAMQVVMVSSWLALGGRRTD